MIFGVSAVADGAPGVQQIVDRLNSLKDSYGQLPGIRSAAARIVRGTGNHDQPGQVNALAAFVRGALVFTADPIDAEFMQTPDLLLLQIQNNGSAQGDCDDHCLLFAALCQAVGIRCMIVGVSASGAGIADHVIALAQLDDGALQFDLVAKGVQQPSYDLTHAVISPA